MKKLFGILMIFVTSLLLSGALVSSAQTLDEGNAPMQSDISAVFSMPRSMPVLADNNLPLLNFLPVVRILNSSNQTTGRISRLAMMECGKGELPPRPCRRSGDSFRSGLLSPVIIVYSLHNIRI